MCTLPAVSTPGHDTRVWAAFPPVQFAYFGFRLLKDAYEMDSSQCVLRVADIRVHLLTACVWLRFQAE